jgi:hypothetical protein
MKVVLTQDLSLNELYGVVNTNKFKIKVLKDIIGFGPSFSTLSLAVLLHGTVKSYHVFMFSTFLELKTLPSFCPVILD